MAANEVAEASYAGMVVAPKVAMFVPYLRTIGRVLRPMRNTEARFPGHHCGPGNGTAGSSSGHRPAFQKTVRCHGRSGSRAGDLKDVR